MGSESVAQETNIRRSVPDPMKNRVQTQIDEGEYALIPVFPLYDVYG